MPLAIDARTVGVIAARSGIGRGPTEKALRLVGLLEEVFKDQFLKDRLVLKGGTAINLFYGEAARLSIDADLDYVGAVEKARMEKERPRILARLEEAGEAAGFSPELDKNAYAGATLHFRYESVFGSDEMVKADINFLNRLVILGEVEHRVASIRAGGEPTAVACLRVDELAGLKLGTLCVRAAPRDLFDVSRFGRLSLDRGLVRKVALFRGFLESLDLTLFDPRAAWSIAAKDIEHDVGSLLPTGDEISKEDLLSAAEPWLIDLLPLNDEEREFQRRLQAGDASMPLLFGLYRVHARIGEHPALRRRMAVKKRSSR